MTYGFDHYFALVRSRNNQIERANQATDEKTRKFFEKEVSNYEREISGEIDFLENRGVDCSSLKMTDDELLAALGL